MQDPPTFTPVPRTPPRDDARAPATTHVPPLGYTQLRLLAECAAGLDGGAANFVFTAGGELRTASPAEAARTPGVLVPAYDEGKYPANEVWLQVAPAAPGGAPNGLRLRAGTADAVFWSDAAVQKFLFPYITSCAGTDASQVLAKAQAAWNHYPATRVSVYALVHVIRHPAGTPLSLENSIHVVYADRLDGEDQPSLSITPLADFVARHPPVPGAVEASRRAAARAGNGDSGGAPRFEVAYRRGGEDAAHPYQQPGYATLRALAEHACSLRHEPRYFLFKQGEAGFRPHPTPELPPVDAGDFVIPAYTPAVPARRPRLHGVWCHTAGARAANLAGAADAVFWSNGAIEQFLYPYYASKGGMREGLKELMDLSWMWMGELPPALRRERGPHPRETADGGAGSMAKASVSVTAAVHLITSEHDEAREASRSGGAGVDGAPVVSRLSPGGDLALLCEERGPDGVRQAQVETMAEFRARQWPRHP